MKCDNVERFLKAAKSRNLIQNPHKCIFLRELLIFSEMQTQTKLI